MGAAALCPAKLESLKAAGRFQVAAATGSGGWSGWVRNSDARDTDRSAIRSQVCYYIFQSIFSQCSVYKFR